MAARRRPAVLALTALALLGPALAVTAGPSAPAAAAPGDLELAGPQRVTLTDPVVLSAVSDTMDDTTSSYAWDLDGDGSTDQITTAPRVRTRFDTPGTYDVSVTRRSATNPGGSATLSVTAVKPRLAAFTMTPAAPIAGRKVTLAMPSEGGRGTEPAAYTWDLGGVQPTRTTATLPVRGGTAPRTAHGKAIGGTQTDVSQVISTAGTGLDVTTSNQFTMQTSAAASFRDTSLAVKGTALMGDGSRIYSFSNVQASASRAAAYPAKSLADQVWDCAKLPAGLPATPCVVLQHSTPEAFYNTGFTDATPSVTWCHPAGKPATPDNTSWVQEAASTATGPGYWATTTGLRGRTQPTHGTRIPTPAAHGRVPDDCSTWKPQTLSWDFGDGTVVVPTAAGPVKHVYAQAGVFKVTLTSLIPYLVNADGKLSPEPSWFKAKRTVTVTVTAEECTSKTVQPGMFAYALGTTSINALDVSKLDSLSCWQRVPAADGHMTWRSPPGTKIFLRTKPSTGANGRYEQLRLSNGPSGSMVLDQSSSSISSLDGSPIDGVWGAPGLPQRVLLHTPSLVVPPKDAQGAYVFPALDQASSGGPTVQGLTPSTVQLVMRWGAVPYTRLSLALPSPMNGGTPDAVESEDPGSVPATRGGRQVAAKALPAGVDYEVDVSGTRMGLVDVKQGFLRHRTDIGAWQAGLDVDLAGIGKLQAPFIPPPSSPPAADQCADAHGPSGLEIGDDGTFHFGGSSFYANPGGITVGPLFLHCVAMHASSDPFVMEGAVQADVLNIPIELDGCFAAGVLESGDKVFACGADYESHQHMVWVRLRGTVSLAGTPFAVSGYAEGHFGDKSTTLLVGGSVGVSYTSFWLDVTGTISVDGGVNVTTGQYSFMGKINGCINPVGPPGPWCGDLAQAGVTSRGAGACIGPAGATWTHDDGWDWFLVSCNLKKEIGVSLDRHATGRGTGTAITMPAGLSDATFVVKGRPGTAPTVRLTRPDGTVIEDTGDRNDDLLTLAHNPPRGETYVRIESHPQAGTWVVDGGADGTSAQLMVPSPAPRVTGAVAGSGATRTLGFTTTNVLAGDDLMFVEDGPDGERLLGTRKAGGAPISIPRAGFASQRTVSAVVFRRGIPITKIAVDDYTSPVVPPLASPDPVTTTMQGADLAVTWGAVSGAQRYRVEVTLADGRVLTQVTTGTSASFSGVTRWSGGAAKVVALSGPGMSSQPRQRALSPRTTVTLRL